jgi:hypothetical protein
MTEETLVTQSVKPGWKLDSSKLRWTLVPFDAMSKVVEVLEYGARKYEYDNWKRVEGAEGPRGRYANALLRHVIAYCSGETNDPESGLHHLAHAGCNCLFLLWFEAQTKLP